MIHRSMEQLDNSDRYKLPFMGDWFLTVDSRKLNGKEKSFQQIFVGGLDIHMEDNEFGTLVIPHEKY